ncbi:MAG: chemotaxis protein CheC [Dehalococcoidales bacterium]|nr:chemotaxis protein CheC [Dehalococcoidales bacterium]
MEQNITETKSVINENDLAVWKWLVRRGIVNSISGLSRMLGEELRIEEMEVKQMPVTDTIFLLGGPENKVICIYLTISGNASGHLLLVHDHKVAYELVDHQMGLSPGQTIELGEMELSLLGEMGNIVGAFFLNVLADVTNLDLSPSPPDVVIDTVSSVISNDIENLLNTHENHYTVKATFGTPAHQMTGSFLVIPTMDFLRTILRHARNY